MTKRTTKIGWIGGSKHQERADSWIERGWRAVKIDTPDGKISFTIPWALHEFPALNNVRSGNGVTLMIAGAMENRIVLCLIGDNQLQESLPHFLSLCDRLKLEDSPRCFWKRKDMHER